MKNTNTMNDELGPVYTKGKSFRARAEARQRAFRAEALGVNHGQWGHLLVEADARQGLNFAHPEAHEAAVERQAAGKGVAWRTFENMLSSQAMCFNLFAPLARRPELAGRVLSPFLPGLERVGALHIEYTPAPDVFGDQTGRGGVDCDGLVEGTTIDGRGLVAVIETKFVEPTFSTCGFRKPGRGAKGQAVCLDDVPIASDRAACLYTSRKRYAYWERTDQHHLLRPAAVPAAGCPIGGSLWQLWTNLALAHEEASRRGATEVRLAVCAPPGNPSFHAAGETISAFRDLVQRPEDVLTIEVDALVAQISKSIPAELTKWADALERRYCGL